MQRLRKFGLGDDAVPNVLTMDVFSDGSAIDSHGNYYPPSSSTAAAGSTAAASSWDHFISWLGQPVATGWPFTNGAAIVGAALLTAAFSRRKRR